jgi:hypothetical protein
MKKEKENKIFRIGNSKAPTISQLTKMVNNLINVHYRTVNIRIVVYKSVTQYEILANDKCFIWFVYTSWKDCLKQYRKLMQNKKKRRIIL